MLQRKDTKENWNKRHWFIVTRKNDFLFSVGKMLDDPNWAYQLLTMAVLGIKGNQMSSKEWCGGYSDDIWNKLDIFARAPVKGQRSAMVFVNCRTPWTENESKARLHRRAGNGQGAVHCSNWRFDVKGMYKFSCVCICFCSLYLFKRCGLLPDFHWFNACSYK